jgi:hypothetical protein
MTDGTCKSVPVLTTLEQEVERMRMEDVSCHTTVSDYPVLTNRYERHVPECRRIWTAVRSNGQWKVVGDCVGRSAILTINPYRAALASDGEVARYVADSLDESRRAKSAARMLLAAIQAHAEAAAQGLNENADLQEYARIAAGLLRA